MRRFQRLNGFEFEEDELVHQEVAAVGSDWLLAESDRDPRLPVDLEIQRLQLVGECPLIDRLSKPGS